MQDVSDSVPDESEGGTKDVEEFDSSSSRSYFYTRILVALCHFLWFASFFAYMGAEWLFTLQQTRYVEVLSRPPHAVTNILRASGALAILAGIGGWWGALHTRHGILFTFSFLIFVTSVIEISCGSVTLSYAGMITLLMQEDVVKDLNQVTDATANSSTDKFLELQQKIHCCGIYSYRDWIGSPWWKMQRQLNSNLVVPDGCCAWPERVEQCNAGHPPYTDVMFPELMHSIGCMKRVSDYMDTLFYTTGTLAFVGGCLKFIGFFGIHFLVNMLLKNQQQTTEDQQCGKNI